MGDTNTSYHIPDTALMFEGGGMRASYTAAVAVVLMEYGITFDYVCGVSAGSSNTVNFLSNDIWRSYTSFVDFVQHPEFGGVKTFLQGKGMFSAQWIYQESGRENGAIPFNMDTFLANPTPCGIQAFDRDTGDSVVWQKENLLTLDELTIRVRASSSLPAVMPATQIDGCVFYDGGLGVGGGIPLQMALNSGCSRIFAVLTRPRGYRKEVPISSGTRAIADYYYAFPHLRQALLTRNARYNAELDRLEALADSGSVYIVYADNMAVTNSTRDIELLKRSYSDGYEQAMKDFPYWMEWFLNA